MQQNKLRTALIVVVSLAAALISATGASAADETAQVSSNITPVGKTFFREASRSARLVFRADLSAPPSSAKILPMKNVRITFPAGMTFRPNSSKTPVCPDSKLSQQSNLADPSGIVNGCATSVIGTGTSAIYLAKINQPAALISDPILVAFNAGVNAEGQARLKIYGYSKTTNVGILMTGTLKGRVLDISVPVLSNDSAVKYFELSFPGPILDRPDIGVKTQGRDPDYVQAACPSGQLQTEAVFELGERTYPGGVPTTPTTTVAAPNHMQACTGAIGQAKLAVKAGKAKAVRSGAKASFRIEVRNSGTRTAGNVVVVSQGGARVRVGNLTPGQRRTVTVRVRVRGKSGAKVKVHFTASSGKVSAKTTGRVLIR